MRRHHHRATEAPTTVSDDVIYWVVRIVPPVAILVIIIVVALVIWKYCSKRGRQGSSENGDMYPLERFPPSGGCKYESISLAPSTFSSASSGSEGYGSLQSHSMLLGRHARSIHEITPVEDIHYMESPDAGEAPVTIGQILVTTAHSISAGLAITVHEVMNLQPRPFSSSFDPYVRIRVASREPDHLHEFQYQTMVKRRTQNPVFEETFKVYLSHEELIRYSAQFVVVNHHKFSRKDILGEVWLPLLEVTTHDELTRSYELVKPPKKSCGEILVSLCYLLTSHRLVLGVMRARNLALAGESGDIDPCVRASLIHGGRKYRRNKTSTKQSEINPVFNEKFFFEIPAEKLDRVQILITVSNEREGGQDSDTDDSESAVGQVILGYRTSSIAHAHWLEVMSNPREIFAQWYELTS